MTIKILVTGGTGLVGNGIQHALNEEKNELTRLFLNTRVQSNSDQIPNWNSEEWIFVGSKDADLTKPEEVEMLFEKHMPDYVVHLASMVGGVYKNMTQNLNFFVTNTLININVLNCCYNFKVKKIFSCLSACVFSINDKLPFTETSSINGEVHNSNSGYALSKRNLMTLNYFFNEARRLSATQGKLPLSDNSCALRAGSEGFDTGVFMSFMPCNIFGPHDNFNATESHFIPSLVKRMCEAECEKKPLKIYGDGSAKRQFIYSHDLGKLIIWLVRNYNDEETIILSPDESEEYSVSEIVNKTAEVFNFSQNILYDTNQANGILSRTVSNKKLQQLYKKKENIDFKFIPYERAIEETMNWFVKNKTSF